MDKDQLSPEKAKGNEPAFPWTVWGANMNGDVFPKRDYPGLTKREWFAGMVALGIIANDGVYEVGSEHHLKNEAYRHADAMLAESEES